MISLRAVLLVAAVTVLMLVAQYAKSAEVELTSDEIYMAQTILFENGHVEVGLPDGVMGPNTRKAIGAWQEYTGYPATGELSAAQVAKLAELGIPKNFTWGAVSISADGYVGGATQYKSGVAAHRAALQACLARSNYIDHCVTNTAWTDGTYEGWLAGYHCSNDDETYVTVGSGISRRDAMKMAYLGVIEEQNYDPWECEMLASVSVTEEYGVSPEAVRDEETH